MHVWDLLVNSLGWLLLGANLFFIAHLHLSSRDGASDAQRGRWLMLVYVVVLPFLTSLTVLVSSVGWSGWDWEKVTELVSYAGVQAGLLGLLAMVWRQGPRASRYVRDRVYPAPLIGVWLGVVSVVVAFLLAVTVTALVYPLPGLMDSPFVSIAGAWVLAFLWWGMALCLALLPQVIVFGVMFGFHLRRSLRGRPYAS